MASNRARRSGQLSADRCCCNGANRVAHPAPVLEDASTRHIAACPGVFGMKVDACSHQVYPSFILC
jgi:hypothetical protein